MAGKHPFFGTFWKPSFLKVKAYKASPYEFYAVVSSYQDSNRPGMPTVMKAWAIEYRGKSIHHPAYGVIPLEYCDEYDLFAETSQDGRRRPDFEFYWPSNEVQLIGTDIEKVIDSFKYQFGA